MSVVVRGQGGGGGGDGGAAGMEELPAGSDLLLAKVGVQGSRQETDEFLSRLLG